MATGAIYLEPYITQTLYCLGNMMQGLIGQGPVDWECLEGVLNDLRKDGTAATVILAIAAAVLASAWSSGSKPAE